MGAVPSAGTCGPSRICPDTLRSLRPVHARLPARRTTSIDQVIGQLATELRDGTLREAGWRARIGAVEQLLRWFARQPIDPETFEAEVHADGEDVYLRACASGDPHAVDTSTLGPSSTFADLGMSIDVHGVGPQLVLVAQVPRQA